MIRFIHTADWQVGKPFARVEDAGKRVLLRQERIAAIGRIGEKARANGAAFVLAAGDIFDTDSPDRSTVSAACRAIGAIGLPVLAIPGNHDSAGAGSLWSQDFFRREQEALAPNFRLLDKPEPVEVGEAVVFPCPLARRHDSGDVTAWLREPGCLARVPEGKVRIVLAHGSTQGFSSVADGEESQGQSNMIDLSRLPADAFDYIALGDWHGMKQVGARAWYSGTPELDRFMKGGGHEPGNVLCVEIRGRGVLPVVTPIRTARLGWQDEAFTFVDDSSLTHFEQHMEEVLGKRVHEDLLRLVLEGNLGLSGDARLGEALDRLGARLLRLKLERNVRVIPSADELARLMDRPDDPMTSRIAVRLAGEQRGGGPEGELAARALRELYAMVVQGGGA
jgi:DNA repair exonuclease SbcCD nuclease subunit